MWSRELGTTAATYGKAARLAEKQAHCDGSSISPRLDETVDHIRKLQQPLTEDGAETNTYRDLTP